MSEFAQQVWSSYLNRHLPNRVKPAIGYMDGDAVADLLYEMAGPVGVGRDPRGQPRARHGVRDLDAALVETASRGDLTPFGSLSPAGRNELVLRLSLSIAAATAERMAGEPFRVPVPGDAPDEVKQMAAFLHVLAGAGKAALDERRPLPDDTAATSVMAVDRRESAGRSHSISAMIGKFLVRLLLGHGKR